MKRSFIAIAALVLCINIYSNQPPTDFVYEEVIQVPEVKKSELYERGLNTFISLFKNSDDAIKTKDKDLGKIVAKGYIDGTYRQMGTTVNHGYEFEIAIYFKDGRYKFKIYDVRHVGNPNNKYPKTGGLLSLEKPRCGYGMMRIMKRDWSKYKKFADAKIEDIISSIKAKMSEVSEIEEEW
jgi:hypothetical protein